MENGMNPGRGLSIDDVLFAIALAIPTLVAAARYLESGPEMTALARAHEDRPTLIAKAGTRETPRTVQDPIASHRQSGTAQDSGTTPSRD